MKSYRDANFALYLLLYSPAGMVHALAHHIHPKQALLALKQLPDPKGRRISFAALSVGGPRPLRGVHVAVDVNLHEK